MGCREGVCRLALCVWRMFTFSRVLPCKVHWCSGYHVCFTRRRSWVQAPDEPFFFSHHRMTWKLNEKVSFCIQYNKQTLLCTQITNTTCLFIVNTHRLFILGIVQLIMSTVVLLYQCIFNCAVLCLSIISSSWTLCVRKITLHVIVVAGHNFLLVHTCDISVIILWRYSFPWPSASISARNCFLSSISSTTVQLCKSTFVCILQASFQEC